MGAPIPTAPQLELQAFLSDLGLTVCEEWPIGQFFVDVWCDEGWVGFEYDGAAYHTTDGQQHRDRERETWLRDNAGVELLRVTPEQLRDKEDLTDRVTTFLEETGATYHERRKRGLWTL